MTSNWRRYRSGGTPEQERGDRIGLLVVDDELDIVDSLREAFADEFEVLGTSSPTDALALFREHGPQLVITDQRMTEMTGLELLREIKRIDPSSVRILITGYSDIRVAVDALNEGLLWKYVPKPWDPDELRALVVEGARRWRATQPRPGPGFLGM